MEKTIEYLAEQLNATVWEKGNLKRIYLNNEGWNTRKMSTKTYIFQDEKGEFQVSCRIECPSQGWQWIKSQEDQIKNKISRSIERVFSSEVFVIMKKGVNTPLNQISYDEIFYSYEAAEEEAKNNWYSSYEIVRFDRSEFQAEVERLDAAINNKAVV